MDRDIVFERGELIGEIHKLEEVEDAIDVYAVHYNETCSASEFKSKINIENLNDQPKQKLLKILEQHCNEVENKSEPVLKIPIKHSIHLKDNIPVSLPARPLPYSQREEVLNQIETLSREGIIAPSTRSIPHRSLLSENLMVASSCAWTIEL